MTILLKEGAIRQFKCARCGRDFERVCYGKRKRLKNYCSKECLFFRGHSGVKKVERIKKDCSFCKKQMLVGPWTLRKGKGKFCSAACRTKSVTMLRTIGSDGYYIVTKDGKRQREHRMVMAEMIGRPLRKDEHVHHINCDKLDNDPKNLYLCDIREHSRIHANLEKVINKLLKAGVVRFCEGTYELAS